MGANESLAAELSWVQNVRRLSPIMYIYDLGRLEFVRIATWKVGIKIGGLNLVRMYARTKLENFRTLQKTASQDEY